MNYRDNELRHALASEYVLGTLTGAARRRFEKLMEQDATLRLIVSSWEQKLGHLHTAIEPVDVPPSVWKNLSKRLAITESHKSPGILSRLWSSLLLWRTMTTALTAVVLFAAYLGFFAPKLVVNQYVAVITNQSQQASWLAKADFQNNRMIIHVVSEQTISIDKAFELWMLPEGESKPISLGLLSPINRTTLLLDEVTITKISRAKGLAVSLEPKGGSLTGLPTGPVLYQGTFTEL